MICQLPWSRKKSANRTYETVATVKLGVLTQIPNLTEYRNEASNGALALVDFAENLAAAGHAQRALLAWERVLDGTPFDKLQTLAATEAIQQFKSKHSDWNIQPNAPI